MLLLGCDAPLPQASDVTVGPLPSEAPRSTPESDAPQNVIPRASLPDDWFEDVTERSHVRFRYQNGREAQRYTLLETVGGGVAMLDYDQDGDLDLYFPGGGSIAEQGVGNSKITGRVGALYRNDGDWQFVDVTEAAGLARAGDYSHGVSAADFDRNGFPDLFVTAFGRCRLYRNDAGTFTDVTASAGLDFNGWSTAAAWADIDRDRFPDLFVAGYANWAFDADVFCGDKERGIRDVCPPLRFAGMQDRLFRNRGNGSFEEITKEAGLSHQGKGMGVVTLDGNHDDWIDFYVANDVGDNFLYLGGPTFPWKEVGLWAGVAKQEYGLAQGSMGVDAGDDNGDGLADLFVTNFEMEDNALYRAEPTEPGEECLFTEATLSAGLQGSCFPYVGFGTGFADFDGDGWLDLFVVNGNVFYHLGQRGYYQPSFLFRNVGKGSFVDATEKGGPYFSVPHVGRGAAVGDLDNDGALDLVVVHQNDPVVLLRNRLTPPRWVRVELEGVDCDREAVGAKLTMEYEGRRLTRWVRSGAGYLSQFDQRTIFPVDRQGSVTLQVVWPGGRAESFGELGINTTHRLVQGQGQALHPTPAPATSVERDAEKQTTP